MKVSLSLAWLCVLLIESNGKMPGSTAEPDYEALDALIDGSNKFAVSFYQAVSKKGGNVVVSPVSLQLVLALAHCGAVGPTAEEISSALGLPSNQELSLNGHKSLIQLLQLPVLTVANRMFVDAAIALKADFKELTSKYFLATAEGADFSKNPNGAREHINQWVEENTNKKIKDLLPSGCIDPSTRVVLVNAVHFKANWALKFEEHDTVDKPFYITPSNSIEVPMMHINKKFNYADNTDLNAQLVELPYEGREMRMVLIVPNEKDGLAAVESKLGGVNLAELFLSLREAQVDLSLPRFKIEQTVDLKEILEDMGMKTMFSDGADFSGLSESEPLRVSKVIQKAFIEVNEKGTEAAAATGLVMMLTCLPVVVEEISVICDHPFMYMLVYNNYPLFIGSVSSFL